MEKNKRYKKVKKILVIFACIIIIVIILCMYSCSHACCWKYNDWWIVGRHVDEVEERYGEFYYVGGSSRAYYIGSDYRSILPRTNENLYWMEVNDEGIVTNVFVGPGIGG